MPCERLSRRRFLHDGGCARFTLSALGFGVGDARALPVSNASGHGTGNERRYPVPTSEGVTIDRDVQVILARVGNMVAAMSLVCPHQNAAVKWVKNDHRFQCSKHDSRYQPDGVYTSGHATRNLDRFPIRLEGDMLVVSLDSVYHSDENPKEWAAAAVAL